jgi:hypothetical protein
MLHTRGTPNRIGSSRTRRHQSSDDKYPHRLSLSFRQERPSFQQFRIQVKARTRALLDQTFKDISFFCLPRTPENVQEGLVSGLGDSQAGAEAVCALPYPARQRCQGDADDPCEPFPTPIADREPPHQCFKGVRVMRFVSRTSCRCHVIDRAVTLDRTQPELP